MPLTPAPSANSLPSNILVAL